MRNLTRNASLVSPAALQPRPRRAPRYGSGIRRIRRGWVHPTLPTMAEVEERLRNYRGFFARLTPEQIAAMDAYDGPEVFGSPEEARKY